MFFNAVMLHNPANPTNTPNTCDMHFFLLLSDYYVHTMDDTKIIGIFAFKRNSYIHWWVRKLAVTCLTPCHIVEMLYCCPLKQFDCLFSSMYLQ